MNVTPLYFYSLINNISKFVKRGIPENLEQTCYFLQYERQKPFLKELHKKIWNDYENGFFTLVEFKIYLLYKHLTCKSFFVNSVNTGEVKNTYKLFSDEQWKKDQDIILGICNNINIKNIKDFLSIKMEDGCDKVEILVKEEKISPIILVKYSDKINFKEPKNKLIINKIKQILKDNE